MTDAKSYIPPPDDVYSAFKSEFRHEPYALMAPALRVVLQGGLENPDDLVVRLAGFARKHSADILGACALEFYAAMRGYANATALLVARDAMAAHKPPTPAERLATARRMAVHGFSQSDAKTLASIGR